MSAPIPFLTPRIEINKQHKAPLTGFIESIIRPAVWRRLPGCNEELLSYLSLILPSPQFDECFKKCQKEEFKVLVEQGRKQRKRAPETVHGGVQSAMRLRDRDSWTPALSALIAEFAGLTDEVIEPEQ